MRLSHLTILLFLLAGPAIATAQGSYSRFELTPVAGLRTGGEFDTSDAIGSFDLDDTSSLGLILNARVDPDRQWEVYYSRQNTEADVSGAFVNDPQFDIEVHYLHAGGTVQGQGKLARPYLVGTVGATRFEPGLPTFDSETFFSFSLGAGLNLFPDQRLGLRIEARGFGTLIGSDEDLFCQTGVDSNFCAIRVDGDVLLQWAASAGLVFRF